MRSLREPMKFHRVEYVKDKAGCVGFQWFTTETEARKAARAFMRTGKDCGVRMSVHDITQSKMGILAALNSFAAHPDNG
jgi:hypothetical protein